MGNKSFFENNRIYIICNAILLLIFTAVCVLYRMAADFIFYGISFILMVTAVACILNNRAIKASSNNEPVKETDDDSAKWEAIREKEDFFALWAHQIKTPIAAMKLLLADEEPDMGDCKRELFKIENYVETALNYLRFEGMSGDMLLEKTSLEPLVKQVVKKYSTIFIHKHLSVELENLDITILTDEKWLSFVLEQALSNALKYTKEGGIKIFTRIPEEGETSADTEIVVRDTGVGISSEDLPRVFEKGYTGYNGRMDMKASGIGLYLCKGVCDKLGHKIRIESEVSKGTDVVITVCKEKVNIGNLTKM
ncbi:Histidine kinase-, DNA gyrase B-, and HSP90-like ATPase [Butyrivibrio sp. INlla18]|uniref:sensor histidine kinase n=1 Tax=Butyrivibrio sp. INlla18 TaxID=1520806 RepID=UPI000881B4FE|nr:ATP-binding protein [Butyrivibrio sp. INlla18]SDA61266.1 Histidine kinase-, DNA gyrase B-, and HSP90-like ATPase [Butyrivibrio sp. INlla18]